MAPAIADALGRWMSLGARPPELEQLALSRFD
jgi:hypothetical protein